MSRVVPCLVLLLLAGAGCGRGEAPPHDHLAYRIEVDAAPVPTGRGFPLRVVRGWRKTLVPEAFDPRALAPLTLRVRDVERLEDGTHVQETLHLLAHAFTLEDVTLTGLTLRAVPRGGGDVHEVVAPTVRIPVRPELPEDAGPVELPVPLLAERPSRLPLLALALGALLAGGFVLLRRRRPAGEAPPDAATARGRALAALEGLRRREAEDAAAVVPLAADVLRAFVAEAFAYDATRRTTPEVQAAAAAGRVPQAAHASALLEILRLADQVKFAARQPSAAERDRLLDRAVAYVEAAGEPR